jgi:hypothetical protein
MGGVTEITDYGLRRREIGKEKVKVRHRHRDLIWNWMHGDGSAVLPAWWWLGRV